MHQEEASNDDLSRARPSRKEDTRRLNETNPYEAERKRAENRDRIERSGEEKQLDAQID
jgi:hypothetical protein